MSGKTLAKLRIFTDLIVIKTKTGKLFPVFTFQFTFYLIPMHCKHFLLPKLSIQMDLRHYWFGY
ncbi:hypothetical protein D3C87_465120 [compost metagenome]